MLSCYGVGSSMLDVCVAGYSLCCKSPAGTQPSSLRPSEIHIPAASWKTTRSASVHHGPKLVIRRCASPGSFQRPLLTSVSKAASEGLLQSMVDA